MDNIFDIIDAKQLLRLNLYARPVVNNDHAKNGLPKYFLVVQSESKETAASIFWKAYVLRLLEKINEMKRNIEMTEDDINSIQKFLEGGCEKYEVLIDPLIGKLIITPPPVDFLHRRFKDNNVISENNFGDYLKLILCGIGFAYLYYFYKNYI